MLRRTGSVDIVTEYSLSAYFFRERGVDGLVRLLVLHHDEVGELILGFEELTLDSAPSITLSAYVAEPASPTAERLQLLAAWTAAFAPALPRG